VDYLGVRCTEAPGLAPRLCISALFVVDHRGWVDRRCDLATIPTRVLFMVRSAAARPAVVESTACRVGAIILMGRLFVAFLLGLVFLQAGFGFLNQFQGPGVRLDKLDMGVLEKHKAAFVAVGLADFVDQHVSWDD